MRRKPGKRAKGTKRRFGVGAAALLSAMACATSAYSQEQTSVFDIPAQPLASALLAFGQQARMSMLAPYELVEGRTARAVQGQMTARAALEQMLAGSGLRFEFVRGDAVRIQAMDAQSDDPNRLGDARDAAPGEEESEEIVVVGTNIRGVYPAASPIAIFTAQDIARTGATTTEQFVEKLPQNFGTRREYASLFASRLPSFEAVNTIDLRGVGVGTTLTLLNGRRLALASSGQVADVSLIPMSAIERVEVLTDGASAIYGADAVGGVINFVLRDNFDGMETKASYGGVTDGHLRQGNVSHTAGRSWGNGNFVASLDYFSASPLEVADRDYAAAGGGTGYLTPVDQRYSGFVTASQDIGDRVTVNGDVLYSLRGIKTWAGQKVSPTSVATQTRETKNATNQYFVNFGVDVDITDSMVASVLGSYADIEVDNDAATVTRLSPTLPPARAAATRDTAYSALDLTAKLDGDLFDLPGGALRFSIGAGIIDEEYLADRNLNNTGGGISGRDLGRRTTYAFGELFAPIVGAEQGIPMLNRLEVSVAARYTDYEDESAPALLQDFGGDTSPKYGLLWSPFQGLNIRGTYGESFRAPTLSELDPTQGQTSLHLAGAGTTPGSGCLLSAPCVTLGGPSTALQVERSESWTAGFDFRPVGTDGPYLTATYFNIDYKNRVAVPDFAAVNASPGAFPDLVFHPTSAAQIEQFLRQYPVLAGRNFQNVPLTDLAAAAATLFGADGQNIWILDGRTRNYADTQVDGFDVSVGDRFETGVGSFHIGADVTRILEFKERASPQSPLTSGTDIPSNPADFRGRFFVNYSNGGLSTALNVNYVDDYKNPLPAGAVKAGDWTTIDWTTSYEFGGENGLPPGFKLTLGVQNLFDEDPPFVAQNNTQAGLNFSTFGFDATNANPLGRVVVVGLSKTW